LSEKSLDGPSPPGPIVTNMRVSTLHALFGDEDGATLVEYSLVVALIAILCIAAISFLGQKVSHMFSTIGASIAAA
jgi:pilus assembly protein Flp/PilA